MKVLGFIIRLVLVIALVVWLADRPGTAQITWRDYVIETSAAVLAVIVVALAYALLLLHRLWRFIIDGPYIWRLKHRIGKMEDGQKELGKGFAALAAGMPSEAGKHAVKARKMLGETGSTRLLQAQAAQQAGDLRAAKAIYQSMCEDPDTAIIGYRGLIVSALRDGDLEQVSRLIIQVEALKKDVPWLNLVRFELATRLENWKQAGEALSAARKAKLLPASIVAKHEATLLLADAKLALQAASAEKALEFAEKACRLMPGWPPAALILAEAQILTKHERAALRTIERTWERAPNPQFIPLLHWAMQGTGSIAHYKQIERMTRGTKESVYSALALAEAAIKADLWGEARRHLMALISRGEATQIVYQMLARLEQREVHNEKLAAQWLAKAVTAPPDATWLCSSCGCAHEYWDATCHACGAFGALEWGIPGRARTSRENAAPKLLQDYLS